MPPKPSHTDERPVAVESSSSKASKSKKRSKKEVSSSSSSSSSSSDSDSSDDEDTQPKKKSKNGASSVNSNPDAIRLFNPDSPRHDNMALHYVATETEALAAVNVLSKETILSVDCEGVALSRTGQLCLIQVSTALNPKTGLFHVFLFDVVALGKKTFDTGLGKLLSQPTPTKLFYDVRRDSESLFHQYGILLRGVCDIQLMEIARRRLRNENINYLPGLARLLSDRFTDMDTDLQRIKDGMSGKYQDEPDLWLKRPLTKEQTIYAAIDVVLLHVLLQEITTPPSEDQIKATKKKKSPKNSTTTVAEEDVEMKDATSDSTTTTTASAAASNNNSASVLPTNETQVKRAAIYVNQRTRSLIEQYSDVVWAASIRDLDGEPDMWSRRHVPLVFHHATFPLSLQKECDSIINAQAAKEAEAKAAASSTAEKKKQRKGKRKAEEQHVTIDPTLFAVTPVAPSEPQKSLAHFVQRVTKTAAARNNYSGIAGTLKHLRSQGDKNAASASSGSQGRPIQSSSSNSSAAAASSLTGHLATARVNTHFADPTAFHPQITKELLAHHAKQTAKQAFKKQKIASSTSF